MALCRESARDPIKSTIGRYFQRIVRLIVRKRPITHERHAESLEFRAIRRIGGMGGPVVGVLRYQNATLRRDDALLIAIEGKTGALRVLKDISCDGGLSRDAAENAAASIQGER